MASIHLAFWRDGQGPYLLADWLTWTLLIGAVYGALRLGWDVSKAVNARAHEQHLSWAAVVFAGVWLGIAVLAALR